MTTIALPRTTTARQAPARIPTSRLVGAGELRKMFDTRSGFWMMTSVVVLAVIADGCRDPVRARPWSSPTTTSRPPSAYPWPSSCP